jgi:hypothetical protein
MGLQRQYRFGMQFVMNPYQTALLSYLAAKGLSHQANITRYAGGRLPSRDIALRIDSATNGEVPLAVWQIAKAERVGITGAAA